MMKTLFILLVSLIILPSCYTIHFTKGDKVPSYYQTSQWHHIGLLGLMEFSKPVNLKALCPADSWDGVRVQKGFLQGLVSLISIPIGGTTNIGGVAYPQTVSVGTFYSPEEVSVSCKK